MICNQNQQNAFNVTVFVATYNRAEYLRQCLDSILNQTMREIYIEPSVPRTTSTTSTGIAERGLQ